MTGVWAARSVSEPRAAMSGFMAALYGCVCAQPGPGSVRVQAEFPRWPIYKLLNEGGRHLAEFGGIYGFDCRDIGRSDDRRYRL